MRTDVGQGKPIVLLHGLASSGGAWEPLLAQLDPTKWRVVAPDLLGFGDSPKPSWNSYDVEQHARVVVATLKKHKITTGVTLVGHSMGCLVATHIASKWPRLVKHLVLYEPPLFVDVPEYRRHRRRRQRLFKLYEYVVARPQLALAYVQRFSRLAGWLGVAMTKDMWLPFERSLRHTIMQQQAHDELRGLTIPTDIVHGRLDFMVTRAEIKRMFYDSPHISIHLVTQLHGITPRAGKYLARLVNR